MKFCTIADCEKPHQAKGFCEMHYRRWHRRGDPLKRLSPGRTPQPKPHKAKGGRKKRGCDIENCERPHRRNGLCSMHANRLRRHGDPLVVLRPAGRTIGTGTVGLDGIGRLDLANGKGVTLVDLIDFPVFVDICWNVTAGGYAVSGGRYLAQAVAARAGIVLAGDETIDHINRNQLDNRRDNLRAASKKLQKSNQGPPTIGALGR